MLLCRPSEVGSHRMAADGGIGPNDAHFRRPSSGIFAAESASIFDKNEIFLSQNRHFCTSFDSLPWVVSSGNEKSDFDRRFRNVF
jgi:hypothetical protein